MARPAKVIVLGDSKDAQRAFKEIRDEADKTESHFSKVGQGLGSALTTGIGAVAVGVGAVAAAAATLFVKGFLDQVEADQLSDKLAAQVGLTDQQAERAGEIASAVYRDAWGESLGEVNETLAALERSFGALTTMSQSTARGLAEDALTIADVWDQDVNEVIRSAGALLDSDLVDSAEEAFDVIATGLQQGVDLNGDFLDTLFEYSTFFEQAGLSAEQMLSGLLAGTEAGMMGVDKVGDAVKEMTLIVQDGAEPVQEALEDLGFNAEALAESLALGGEFGSAAFHSILAALSEVEDPLEQHRLAVLLLGTPYEDLGAVGADVLGALADDTLELVDTTDVANLAYDNLGTAIEEFKREGSGAIQDFVASALSALGFGGEDGSLQSGITDINTWIEENQEQIREWGEEFGTTVGQMWDDSQEIIATLQDIIAVIGHTIDALPGWAREWETWAGVIEASISPLLNIIASIRGFMDSRPGSGSLYAGDDFTRQSTGGTGGNTVGIPVYHKGGIVPQVPGGEMLALVQSGETILPPQLDISAGGDVIQLVVDGRVIAEAVRDNLVKVGRRNGTTGL